MKKKVVSIMMTAALAAGMLAGCGNSDSGSSNAAYRMVSIRGSGKRQR